MTLTLLAASPYVAPGCSNGVGPVVLAAPDPQALLGVLLAVLLALVGCVGVGAAALLLRIVLPGAASAADGALERLGTKGLLLGGLLPLVGAGLIAQGVGQSGSEGLGLVFLLLIGLPLTLATLVGAMAAIPRVGAGALQRGTRAGPLARCAVGGLVIGLSMVSWAVPPLGFLVSLLLAGWFLGAGLGAFFRRGPRPQRAPPSAPPEVPVG